MSEPARLRSRCPVSSTIAFFVILAVAPPARAEEIDVLGPYPFAPAGTEEVWIEMSDGVKLNGFLFRPGPEGQFPVIVRITPYGDVAPRPYLAAGYAHLNVTVRGTAASQGALCVLCQREQLDTVEVVAWARAQAWSDGRIALWGYSWPGAYALIPAIRNAPGVKALVVEAPVSRGHFPGLFHHGTIATILLAAAVPLPAALSFYNTDGGAWYDDDRTDDALGAAAFYQSVLEAILGLDFTWSSAAYWRERAMDPRGLAVPTLYVAGWLDALTRHVLRSYEETVGEKALIVGPWVHTEAYDHGTGGREVTQPAGGDPLATFSGAEAHRPGPPDVVRAWLDRHVRGDATAPAVPPVTYYDVAETDVTLGWRTAASWPPSPDSIRTFYLSGARSHSAASLNDGSLTKAPPGFAVRDDGTLVDLLVDDPAATAPDTYVYDPASGTSDAASRWNNTIDQPTLLVDQRADELTKLTYTTAPLERPLALAGPIEVRLYASTDAPDVDFFVKVTDVHPDGSSLLLADGAVRASHRAVDESRSRPGAPHLPDDEALKAEVRPGVVYPIRIDVSPIAATLAPGHRLRIAIASGDMPTHAPSPHPAINRILHDRHHRSAIVVTVR